MTRIPDRIERLRQRRTDQETGYVLLKEARLVKSASDTSEDARQYISEAMEAVPSEYTQNTFKQCGRIENQLGKEFERRELAVEFAHQGSVTNNTNIRFYSDIDLLVIPKWFNSVKAPLVPSRPYRGDPISDLMLIRQICEETLADKFPAADVGVKGTKSVSISGGSLTRKVDVVPANWLDTNEYLNTGDIAHRGIRILNTEGPERVTNYPFLHNDLLDSRDRSTRGQLRRLIRFLKSVKADSDRDIPVSSYDICGLCYNMSESELLQGQDGDVNLAFEFLKFGNKLLKYPEARENLYVPNQTRLLFGNGGTTPLALGELLKDLIEILQRL